MLRGRQIEVLGVDEPLEAEGVHAAAPVVGPLAQLGRGHGHLDDLRAADVLVAERPQEAEEDVRVRAARGLGGRSQGPIMSAASCTVKSGLFRASSRAFKVGRGVGLHGGGEHCPPAPALLVEGRGRARARGRLISFASSSQTSAGRPWLALGEHEPHPPDGQTARGRVVEGDLVAAAGGVVALLLRHHGAAEGLKQVAVESWKVAFSARPDPGPGEQPAVPGAEVAGPHEQGERGPVVYGHVNGDAEPGVIQRARRKIWSIRMSLRRGQVFQCLGGRRGQHDLVGVEEVGEGEQVHLLAGPLGEVGG